MGVLYNVQRVQQKRREELMCGVKQYLPGMTVLLHTCTHRTWNYVHRVKSYKFLAQMGWGS